MLTNPRTVRGDRPLAGLRPSTPTGRRALAQADNFQGLPEGITRWRLSAALRAAARHLDLNPMMLRLLEHYIDCTWDADWAADSEPVVIRPLVETATVLGRTERQIRNVERALVERGLLAWRDSGNHHRRGRRDYRTGRLLYGYGPSLAPLGARAEEIIALAERARAETAAMGRLRIGIAALRRRLRSHLATAFDRGIANQEMDDATALLESMPNRLRAGDGFDKLTCWHQALTDTCQSLEARLDEDHTNDGPRITREISAVAEIFETPYTETETDHTINGTSTHKFKIPDNHQAEPKKPMPSLILVRQCMNDNRRCTTTRIEDWHAVISEMQERAILLDIDTQSWGEACTKLGRVSAAICALIVEDRVQREGVEALRNPRAYFNALVKRGTRQKLDMTGSLHRIARQRHEPRPSTAQYGNAKGPAVSPSYDHSADHWRASA